MYNSNNLKMENTTTMTEQIQLEKKYWFKKIKSELDKRKNNEIRNIIIKDILQLDKCCETDDYYINTKIPNWSKEYSMMDDFLIDKENYEKNGLSLYSHSGDKINPFMINQWYKECKDEILKRI